MADSYPKPRLIRKLPHGRSWVQYSRPRPEDLAGVDFETRLCGKKRVVIDGRISHVD